jgi:hypothetical protein
MCRQALREYLVKQVPNDAPGDSGSKQNKIDALLSLPRADHFDEAEAAQLRQLISVNEARSLRQSILECRACDPSVGSGAFLVGMLHEMVAVVAKLDWLIHGPAHLQLT